MTFVLGGTDYSDKVEVTGYEVRPRKVKGTSAGELLNGETIEDLIVTKTDLNVAFVAMAESDVSNLAYLCNSEYVKLRFSDPITATDVEGTYIPTINSLKMAIDQGESLNSNPNIRYYYGFSVSFKER